MNDKEQELREIEARIAVELFGWQWVQFPHGNRVWLDTAERADALLDIGRVIKADSSQKRFDEWDTGVPRYARDIAAAFEAVEKMRERGYWWNMWAAHSGNHFVEMGEYVDGDLYQAVHISHIQAPTLAEAIARCIVAALDAAKTKTD